MNSFEMGWFIGIFEGEGWVSYSSHSLKICVKMTDLDTVDRIKEVVGFGNINVVEPDDVSHKTAWVWSSSKGEESVGLLLGMYPFLSERRQGQCMKELVKYQNRTQRPEVMCGTKQGYDKHYRNNEESCEHCREAYNQYRREIWAQKSCADCDKSIGKDSVRCRSCSASLRWRQYREEVLI